MRLNTTNPAALDECVAPLDEQDQRALQQYWEQVLREEWGPRTKRIPLFPTGELTPRERREARRAIAAIATASRLAPVLELRSGPVAVAGEAA